MSEAVHVENLTKVYGTGHTAVTALANATLTVHRGELTAIIGPSGSGKTTLLTAIAGIIEPTSGRVEVSGVTSFDNGWKVRDLARFRRDHLGFIFQSHNLIPFLNARDNVLIALQVSGAKGTKAKRIAQELLDYLGVGDRQGHFPAKLSGGEQQRVAIARALANSPQIVLADEPTAALDTERGRSVMELFRKIVRERNSALICVTHDVRMIEGFDRVYHVNDGIVTA
jgi:putative ABC transport system ATP-binding protein